MECPVCAGLAKNITLPDFDGKSFKCDECGEYDISGTADQRFLELDLTVGKKHYVRQNNLPVVDIARVLTLFVFNDNWIVERRPKDLSYSTSDNEILRTI